MLDFSDAQDQKEFTPGPVPAGSIVMLEMEVLEPAQERQALGNNLYSVAQSGLIQIYCKFTVAHGTYQGVSFRQNITLPLGVQTAQLNPKQQQACNIGNATLKAICLAARKPPKVNSVASLTGLRFPARLKLNSKPTAKDDGRVFWNNELALVITPDKEAYAAVYSGGEIITDGPVTGDGGKRPTQNGNGYPDDPGYEQPPASAYESDVPF